MSRRIASLTLVLLLTLLVAAGAFAAASADGYSIERWTLDNGGGVSAAGRYSLAGTIGQPDASTMMTGETYGLTGGYWGAVSARMVFLPLILRQPFTAESK
jgi:hypothetical protein